MKKGFTLIELLVVISTIAILSAVGLVSYQNIRKSAQDAKIKSDLNAIKKAYESNYDPTANGGQGGYKRLSADSVSSTYFADGKLPKQPDGTSYTFAYGPDAVAPNNKTDGYKVSSTALSDGTTPTVVSNQGTAQLNSCDPGNTLSNGLVGYWKMDEGSGTLVKDSSDRGNDASFAGSPSWTPGKFIYGINNGNTTNDYINAPNIDIASEWTTSAWFQYPLTTTGANWHTLFRGNAGDHQVIVRRTDMQLGMYDNVGVSGFRATGYIITSLSTGWHHLVTVGQSGIQKFYIDGNLVGQTDRQSTTDIRSIGNYFGGNQNWGAVDEVRIYNRTLFSAEVSALYNGGTGCVQ